MAIVLGTVNTNCNTHHHHKRSLSVNTALPNSSTETFFHHKRSLSVNTALSSLSFHNKITTGVQTTSSRVAVKKQHSRRHSTTVFPSSSSLLVFSSSTKHNENAPLDEEEKFNKGFFDFSLLSLCQDDDEDEILDNSCLVEQEEEETNENSPLGFRDDDGCMDYIYNTPKRQPETARSSMLLNPPPPPCIMCPSHTPRGGGFGGAIVEIDFEQVPECILMPLCDADDEGEDDNNDYCPVLNGSSSSMFSNGDFRSGSQEQQYRMPLRLPYRPSSAVVFQSWQ
jgi:hypothetical protein